MFVPVCSSTPLTPAITNFPFAADSTQAPGALPVALKARCGVVVRTKANPANPTGLSLLVSGRYIRFQKSEPNEVISIVFSGLVDPKGRFSHLCMCRVPDSSNRRSVIAWRAIIGSCARRICQRRAWELRGKRCSRNEAGMFFEISNISRRIWQCCWRRASDSMSGV
jgi:hypothetical protein